MQSDFTWGRWFSESSWKRCDVNFENLVPIIHGGMLLEEPEAEKTAYEKYEIAQG